MEMVMVMVINTVIVIAIPGTHYNNVNSSEVMQQFILISSPGFQRR